MKREYDAETKAWLKANSRKLPKMVNGNRHEVCVGSLADLTIVAERSEVSVMASNPRKGSDVYIRDHFLIETSQSKMPGWVEGGPTMPIKQWRRFKAPKKAA